MRPAILKIKGSAAQSLPAKNSDAVADHGEPTAPPQHEIAGAHNWQDHLMVVLSIEQSSDAALDQ